MAVPPGLREARTLREDELLELTHAVAKELDARGERLPRGWREEAVGDLRTGRLSGWATPPGPGGGGLGFFSCRGARAFGHVHVLEGPGPVDRAFELLDRIAASPDVAAVSLTLGVTGIGPVEEEELVRRWSARTGRTAVVREGLERDLADPSLDAELAVPPRMTLVPASRVTSAAMADLDWRGFRGSLDADLFGNDAAENTRMVDHILGGGLGSVLEPASAGLIAPDGSLAGLVLSVELSPHIGLVADLVVDPSHRRAGLGGYLLRLTLRALRALGYASARLWVTEGNLGARGLYDALGFRAYARAIVYLQAVGASLPHPQRDR